MRAAHCCGAKADGAKADGAGGWPVKLAWSALKGALMSSELLPGMVCLPFGWL